MRTTSTIERMPTILTVQLGWPSDDRGQLVQAKPFELPGALVWDESVGNWERITSDEVGRPS